MRCHNKNVSTKHGYRYNRGKLSLGWALSCVGAPALTAKLFVYTPVFLLAVDTAVPGRVVTTLLLVFYSSA